MIRALTLSAPRSQAIALGRARLRISWDDRPMPSVDAPVALFFGAGTLYNRDDREYLVKAFPVNIRFDAREVHLACYFPDAFLPLGQVRAGRSETRRLPTCTGRCDGAADANHPSTLRYFHATYRDHPSPEPGATSCCWTPRKWKEAATGPGNFVGTSFIFSHRAVLNTLEGDPRFFFDDSQTPQAQGTGTEEWGGGGDYWGGRNMTLPFAGHPVGRGNARSREASPKTRSSRRTASCSPT